MPNIIQTYSSPKGRINQIKGEMLRVAEPVEVLSLGTTMQKFPKNKGDNITYRARIPTGGSAANANSINRWSVSAQAHQVQEGVTPPSEALNYRDVNVQIQQYACLYAYTDKAAELYEDNIPADQKLQTGERMGLVREMVRYGEMKASSNVLYVGGTTRATVNGTVSYNALSLMSRTLMTNHGKMKTKILAPGPAYDTSAIEAGFIVFCHTDCEHDIRRLEDFVPVAKYANRSPISPHELGAVGRFRFIVSPELAPYLSAGVAVAGTGLLSLGNDFVDVYPMIVCAEDGCYDIALNTNFDVIEIPHTLKSKEDPLMQRGYVGAKFWTASKLVNPGWVGVIECGVTNLN